jgi:hypothetical protein
VSQSNSTIWYFVRGDTFPFLADADYAAQALQQAAGEWDSLALGISISQAAHKEDVNSNLVYTVNN